MTSIPLPSQAGEKVLDIYFFYSQTCPHCAQQKPLMEYIDKHNEEVKLSAYEVSEHPEKWRDFLAQYHFMVIFNPRTRDRGICTKTAFSFVCLHHCPSRWLQSLCFYCADYSPLFTYSY